MITLIAVLIFQANAAPAHKITRPSPDHSDCFYYRRADYTRAETASYLKKRGVTLTVEQYCKIDAEEQKSIDEMQQCKQTDEGC